MKSINKQLILSELIRSREAIDAAIAYVQADSGPAGASTTGMRVIRAGEGRAVAILTRLRDAGGTMKQREFEEACISNCRTLVGAGGFIARGSITKQSDNIGVGEYTLTSKGMETIEKWEARYGSDWESKLESKDILSNTNVSNNQKVRLLPNKE